MQLMIKIFIYLFSLIPLFFYWIIDEINLENIHFNISSILKEKDKIIKQNISVIVLLFLIAMLFFIHCILSSDFKKISKDVPIEIKKIKNKKYETLVFFTTYLFPLIDSDLSHLRGIIKIIFLLLIIGCILIKTEYYCYSPTLSILGYKLYKIKYIENEKEKMKIILTKDLLVLGDKIKKIEISNDLIIGKKAKK